MLFHPAQFPNGKEQLNLSRLKDLSLKKVNFPGENNYEYWWFRVYNENYSFYNENYGFYNENYSY